MIAAEGLDDGSKLLRNIAEGTAKGSKNWDNFEQIARSLLQQAYDAGLYEHRSTIEKK